MAVDGGARPQADRRRRRLRSILYFLLFPNTLVSLHPDYVMLHTLWPRAPDRTEVVCEWFFEPEAIAGAGLRPDRRGRASGTRSTARTGTSARSRSRGWRSRAFDARPLHDAGGRRARLRRDGRRALPGGAATESTRNGNGRPRLRRDRRRRRPQRPDRGRLPRARGPARVRARARATCSAARA